MKQTVSAQLYTIRDHLTTKEDFVATMEKLQSMGFEYLQYSGVPISLDPKWVRQVLDRYNLKVCCSHMPWERLLNEPEKVAEDNLIMGSPIVGLSAYPENKLETKEEMNRYIGQIQKIGRVMQDNGLKFALHNHVNEFHRIDGKTVLQHMREQTNPAAIEFIFCCHWAMVGGADPIQYLREFEGRVTCCHYKDFVIIGGARHFAPVGQGNMNYEGIWRACEETGVKYALIEQDVCQKDSLDCMAESREYMLKLGTALDKEMG